MPDILENQSEALINAREAAAQGVLSPATIPLLADSQNFHGYHKLHWTLRFPLPAPSQTGSRSSAVWTTRPSSPGRGHSLCRPTQFTPLLKMLQDVPFLQLPDIVQCFGPVRATEHSLHISDTIQNWLRTGAPRLFNHIDLLQPWLVGAQIPPALCKYFTGELTMTRLVTLIRSCTVDHKEAVDRAVQASRAERGSEKRQKTYLPHPADLPPGSSAASPPPTRGQLLPRSALVLQLQHLTTQADL